MLVLSREVDEKIICDLGDGRFLKIMPTQIRGKKVRLAIEADRSVSISRSEHHADGASFAKKDGFLIDQAQWIFRDACFVLEKIADQAANVDDYMIASRAHLDLKNILSKLSPRTVNADPIATSGDAASSLQMKEIAQ